MTQDTRLLRLVTLIKLALHPSPGREQIFLALCIGFMCHVLFSAAVAAMILEMFFGLSKSFGTVPWPWACLSNLALIIQFPLAHSFLLTAKGSRFLSRLIPGAHGVTLATTTYAIIASLQLLSLFLLWTPSQIIWWQADGWMFWFICILYTLSWCLLIKASFDAGAEVQSGALGWMSLMGKVRPVFPDMPTEGLFSIIRQPIYVSFAMTLWTVPVWTPDQLILAICYSLYCFLAPQLKERRFEIRYGKRFTQYQKDVPYVIPRLFNSRTNTNAE